MRLWLAGLFIAVGLSPAWLSSASAADDIVIGFATAQSGFVQPYDADGLRMAKLWIDETNAKGGLLGKKIRYVGATGPFRFDRNGDVTGPMLLWKLSNGHIATEKMLSLDEMNALGQKAGF